MARKVRIQYPGAISNVVNRGDRREAIFADAEDRERPLQTLAEACQKTGWQVHADCLMRSHSHLVVEAPQPRLVVGILFSALSAASSPPRTNPYREYDNFTRWYHCGKNPRGARTLSLSQYMSPFS